MHRRLDLGTFLRTWCIHDTLLFCRQLGTVNKKYLNMMFGSDGVVSLHVVYWIKTTTWSKFQNILYDLYNFHLPTAIVAFSCCSEWEDIANITIQHIIAKIWYSAFGLANWSHVIMASCHNAWLHIVLLLIRLLINWPVNRYKTTAFYSK